MILEVDKILEVPIVMLIWMSKNNYLASRQFCRTAVFISFLFQQMKCMSVIDITTFGDFCIVLSIA